MIHMIIALKCFTEPDVYMVVIIRDIDSIVKAVFISLVGQQIVGVHRLILSSNTERMYE